MNLINILHLKLEKNRVFGLDFLRMLAVMFVVYSHSIQLLPPKLTTLLNFAYFDGVCIFFVLSGFLIGQILIKSVEKKGLDAKNLLNFWIRRWLRTLPNYYLFVFILAILSKIFIVGFPLKAVIPFLFFVQNIYKSNDAFFGESWSLCVEEWFYLLVPFFIFLSMKIFKIRFKTNIIIISIFFLLFSTILRYYLFTYDYLPKMGDYRRVLILRLDNIMYGVIAAYISFYYSSFWKKSKNIFFILGIILIIIWKFYSERFPIQSFYYSNIFYPLMCLAIFCLLPVLSSYKIQKHNMITKGITYISLISYSLYLIHYSLILKLFINTILINYLDNSLASIILKNVFYWITSLLCSVLLYKFFELPILKFREKITLK